MADDLNVESRAKSVPRLKYIDGLRGLAALYVAFYHAVADVPLHNSMVRAVGWAFQFGHFAVAVFIVVSGYCLMRPVALSADGKISGGLREYARRRMRRILPVYYAVLIPSVIAAAIAGSHYTAGTAEEADVLRLTPGTILSHLFFVHNLHPQWASAFDPPMWSVAMECQIYVLFPLLLLPVWRRAGSAGVISAAFAVGLAPHFLFPARMNLDWTCPWYLGLFALGMGGAVASFSACTQSVWQRRHVPWGTLASAFGLAAAIVIAGQPGMPLAAMWLPDILIGCTIAASLIQFTAVSTSRTLQGRGRAPWSAAMDLLESKQCGRLGACSYSLYLLHAPVLWAVSCLTSTWHANDDQSTVARLLIGVPLAIAVSYASYSMVERRFMSHRD